MTAPHQPITSLDDVPTAVEAVLRTVLDSAVPAAGMVAPVVGAAGEELRDFVLQGGKRIRPVFAHAGWLAGVSSPQRSGPPIAVGGSTGTPDETDVLRVGAALELIQACALIHDDIIDHSDTRRGRPTLHRRFETRHRAAGWSGDATDHGVASAILVGDLALAWADDLVHGIVPGTEPGAGRRSLPATSAAVWSAMRTEVLGGQLLDIITEADGDDTVEAAYRVMRFKTAAYTVVRPLQLGATLAGAPESLIDDLRSAGEDLGIAFQLRDDLLGVFGDPERTGKPSGDDLVEGKQTVLVAIGLDRAARRNPELAGRLRTLIGRPLTDDEVATARGILHDVGAVDEIETRIAGLVESATATLDDADLGADIRAQLVALATRIAHRES
ncbi:polyprenyl synthetase family protein [Gordonia soli]|uniref:Geranylgeranyl pyrophosphate synthase n=1 Tax=Gordonia soli NBRC 108243 TaxID=1223545 RepID=M0QM93_9ACTN|nr:polyprenyl synthetase family protein [Gordonia soli]GAC69539.1 geranylgeranyl pyrophosphate synthase [Gordonia soli NBRC 108243]